MGKIDFLKERAKEFWENALDLFQKERYNLCAFSLEQSFKLWLKYLIGKRLGNRPQIHYLVELIKELSKTYDSSEILEYLKENELFLDDLSDAYFVSRYYPKRFSKSLTEKLIKECEKFIKLTEKITKKSFLTYENIG